MNTKKQQNNFFATKKDLKCFATKKDLAYLKKEVVQEVGQQVEKLAIMMQENFATKKDLERFATKKDLERFATKKDLEYGLEKTKQEILDESVKTRDETLIMKDEIVKKVLEKEQEMAAMGLGLSRHEEILNNHEKKIIYLENLSGGIATSS